MHSLVRKVFSKLHTLDPEEEEAKLIVPEAENEVELKMSVTANDVQAGQSLEPQAEPSDPEASTSDAQTVESQPPAEQAPEKVPEETPEEDTPPFSAISSAKRPEC
jgi:brefeldin A-resistance guanine nucleotide exchange factor 1